MRGSSFPPAQDNIWIALVGGTLLGKIDLRFDARIRTNQNDAPDYAVHRVYRPGEKEDLKRGDDFARFRWGSAVVLIRMFLEKKFVKAWDVVSLGQPLLTRLLREPFRSNPEVLTEILLPHLLYIINCCCLCSICSN